MDLFPPIGYQELLLIAEENFSAVLPRSPSQSIFYPVLNRDYGIQIAKDWNVGDLNSGFAGFVTQFEVEDKYISQFEIQVVGSSELHQEPWIPAADLAEFNRYIVGKIKIVTTYYGDLLTIKIDRATNLPITISQPR